jgi:hypothetical protein
MEDVWRLVVISICFLPDRPLLYRVTDFQKCVTLFGDVPSYYEKCLALIKMLLRFWLVFSCR